MILETLFSELKDINEVAPNIHIGGCGFFAKQTYDTLVKLGYTPKIIVLSPRIKDVKMYFDGIDPDTLIIAHIVVELGGKFIDNRAVYETTDDVDSCWGMPSLEISTDNLDRLLKGGGWNSAFKERHKPLIEERFVECYNNLKITLGNID